MLLPTMWNRNVLVALIVLVTATTYIILLVTISSPNLKVNKTVRKHWTPEFVKSMAVLNSSFSDPNTVLSSTRDVSLRKRLPQCLIIGFSKCGTTALRGFLTLHPDIVSPLREMRYFTLHYDRGPEWYRDQMPLSTTSQVTVEKSAGYITSPDALKRIYQFNPSLKLIVMVRDPVTRLQSEYARCVSHNSNTKVPTFRAWCGGSARSANVLRLVDYATPMENVYRLFRKEQVLVLSEEDLEETPLKVLKEAEGFLGRRPAFTESDIVYNKDKGFFCFNTSSLKFPKVKTAIMLNEKTGCLGSQKGRAHPEIDEKFFKELVKSIRTYNQRLFRLIGRRIRWENFKN